jgi:hypothetical protein
MARRFVTSLFLCSLALACGDSDDDGDNGGTDTGGSTSSTTGEGSGDTGGGSDGGSDSGDTTTGGDATTGTGSGTGSTTGGIDKEPPPDCSGIDLLELPEDPGARGPWPVGTRKAVLGGMPSTLELPNDELTVQVWYPAEVGSEAGLETKSWDLREFLPEDQQDIDPDPAFFLGCDCYDDLPLDTTHGPYATLMFMHGFSGFRIQSVEFMSHWASRGFVVVAADHPSIGLAALIVGGMDAVAEALELLGQGECDLAEFEGARGPTSDGLALLDELQSPAGDLAFLAGFIDPERIGVAGHSAGGGALAPLAAYPGVRVLVPMAMQGVCDAAWLVSTTVIGGMVDGIVKYTEQEEGYEEAPPRKRLVGIADGGHMAFTSFCPMGEDRGGILQVALDAGVVFPDGFVDMVGPLAADGCGDEYLPAEEGWALVNFVTAGTFEETLICMPERAEQLSNTLTLFPVAAGDYREEP